MARVAAIGDAHLGRSYLPRITPEGVNQREHDFEESFEAAVELALSLAPDAIVWLGDIFDAPRPTYRSYRVAQRSLARIREHGIALVAISGNHDTPRLPGTASPYATLADSFPEQHFAYRLAYESFDLPGLRVHAVPQTMGVEATLDALAQADANRSLDHSNLLLTHPRIKQVEPPMRDINEIEIDAGDLRMDLTLLGHYHFHVKVREGMWYAGSTDTFTWADNPGTPKGILMLDTDSGNVTHHPVEDRRPFAHLEPIAAAGLSPGEIETLMLERASGVPQGAIARLYINGVDPHAYRLVDLAAVQQAAGAALWFHAIPDPLPGATTVDDLPSRDTLADRWASYLERQDLTGYESDRIRAMGEEQIHAAIDAAT